MPHSERDPRAARAEATDRWLRRLWRPAVSCAGLAESGGLALAAVGSHARREAGPHSDLDLVLLYDDGCLDRSGRPIGVDDADLAALAEALWYPIWDQGRRLDHSVRSVGQCRGVAADDLPALVGLLDLRTIAGDGDVVDRTRTLVAHDWRSAARGRLGLVLDAVRARHARFGDLATMTDPDLKECAGGIRDMAVLRALTAAWLADRPHGDLDTAYRRLLEVRDAVHEVTGRGRDRLLRQDAPAVAERLALGGPGELAERVADAARTMSAGLETTVRRATQSQRARVRQGPGSGTARLTPLGFGVYRHDGEVVVGGIPARTGDPLLGLRAAGMAAARGLTLSPATVGALADHPVPAFPWGTAARELFGCLLAAGPGLGPVWEPLARAGVIDRWLPCWSSVRGVLQISAVHRHTVDRHQLETVACCAVLLPRVSRPDLLLVAALLHDIGKTSANRAELADHGELGAPVAGQAARDLGFDAADAAVIEVLVRRHLVLAELATARDPRDPATIEDLLTAVDSDPLALELLWALTEADARATGGPAWSTARRAAIAALARTAQRLLSRRLPPALPLPDSTPPPPGLLGAVTGDGPQVRLEPSVTAGAVYALVTAAADRAGLFADIAALLAAAGLQVRAAELATTDGIAHDRWEVDPVDAARPDPGALTRRLRRLEAGDRAVLRGMATRPVVVDRLEWLTDAGSPSPAGAAATIVQLRAADSPAVLAAVGAAFVRAGVVVRSARIRTYAGRRVDSFALTTRAGAPLRATDRAALEQVLPG
ncbi:MAG: HD domain-containing protein [Austwickia sp.]|nr:HD domain-containing protein [Austwickia sp.]MBK8436965.1 HD domain-containing protein [Austwickia sp.]MBK9100592.1 HD domain-containing protein [Austwickia sp.]